MGMTMEAVPAGREVQGRSENAQGLATACPGSSGSSSQGWPCLRERTSPPPPPPSRNGVQELHRGTRQPRLHRQICAPDPSGLVSGLAVLPGTGLPHTYGCSAAR